MTILQEIAVYKQQLLDEGYYEEKLKTLIKRDATAKITLRQQLASDELSIIAELKAKSPTVSDIPARDMNQQIQLYDKYGAACISILTDERYFAGSFERLNELSIETKLPVLCKDFIIDSRQIDVAKYAGASVILLIVNLLTDQQLKQLYDYAQSLQLEVLVEVHDKEELERAHQLGAEIIGVNNRNLKTFVTDVNHTNEILQHKKDAYYISESGIKTVSDIERIVSAGIDGALIGETLMRQPELLLQFRKSKQS